MNNKNCVIFKAVKNGILISLKDNIEFEIIKETLETKISDASKFFDTHKTNMFFKGRDLTSEEETELIDIIANKTDMNIVFVASGKEININKLENEQSKQKAKDKKELAKNNAKPEESKEELPRNTDLKPTKYFNGNVRSGQVFEVEGSAVILGDINPGAHVKATGNIIVLGSIKGIAHAGCFGDDKSYIASCSLRPVQLRIGEVITRFEAEDIAKTSLQPEYAYVEDGVLYVAPLI